MDRQILYPAQIPLVEDGLNAQRNAMVGLGHLAAATFGANTVAASGFACSPAEGLAVTIAPGALLAPGVVDASAYGTLAAVSSALVRQFISRDPVSLTVPGAGATYVVYVTPQTVDSDSTVLPFYNAADPSVTYAGQNNSGLAAPTVRRDEAALAIGSSVPSGAYPLWQIVVPAGATTLTADMLSIASGAPFYPSLAAVAPRIVAPFNAQLAAAMGGYPLNAVVADTKTRCVFWVSTADANVSVPGATGAAWQSLFTGLAVLNGGNTFTGEQNMTGSLNVTGTITALLASSTQKVTLRRGSSFAGINSYDGSSWHYLYIDDDDTATTAKGTLAFSNAAQTFTENQTFSGQTLVPDITEFDGKDALNAETAEGRYIRSVSGTGQTRITGLVENADGRAVASTSTTSTVLANLSDLPLAATQKILRFAVSAADVTVVSFTESFSSAQEGEINIQLTCEQSPQNLSVSNFACFETSTITATNFKLHIKFVQASLGFGAQSAPTIVHVTAIGPK